jgi:5-formyltetrahydrofolate cyclo-ligase
MASAESVALADQKRSLRRAMRDRRSGLGADERARMTAAATAHLTALPEVRAALAGGGCVAGFVATRAEIDPAVALGDARLRGARVAFPRVVVAPEGVTTPVAEGVPATSARGVDVRVGSGGRPRLRFHLAAPDQLRPGAFGIEEPPDTLPEVRASDVEVMIVPGLAFDERGRRLGFGGGNYDELLGTAAGRPRFVVGFGYDFQVVEACPADGGDAAVDCVVTDARVIRCVPATVGDGGLS